jgi:hypothetical protein
MTPPVVPARPTIALDLSAASGAPSAADTSLQPPPLVPSVTSSLNTIAQLDQVSRAVATASTVPSLSSMMGGLQSVHGGSSGGFGLPRSSASGSLLSFFDIAPPSLVTHGSLLPLSPSHNDSKKPTDQLLPPSKGDGKRQRSRSASRGDKMSQRPKMSRVRSSLLGRRGSVATMRLRINHYQQERKGPPAPTVHTLRVQDFKALITKDVRAACGTIIEQYAAALREVLVTPNDIVKKIQPLLAQKSKPTSPLPSPAQSPTVATMTAVAAGIPLSTVSTPVPLTSTATAMFPSTPSLTSMHHITIEGLPADFTPVHTPSSVQRPPPVDTSSSAPSSPAVNVSTATATATASLTHSDSSIRPPQQSCQHPPPPPPPPPPPSQPRVTGDDVQLPGPIGPLLLRTSSTSSSSSIDSVTGEPIPNLHLPDAAIASFSASSYDRNQSFPHRPPGCDDATCDSVAKAAAAVQAMATAAGLTVSRVGGGEICGEHSNTKADVSATSTTTTTTSERKGPIVAPEPPVATASTATAGATTGAANKSTTGSIKTMVASNEVQDFILIEIINPQVCVHSEETRGRVLFKTMRLIFQTRLHWRAPLIPSFTSSMTNSSVSHQPIPQRSASAQATPYAIHPTGFSSSVPSSANVTPLPSARGTGAFGGTITTTTLLPPNITGGIPLSFSGTPTTFSSPPPSSTSRGRFLFPTTHTAGVPHPHLSVNIAPSGSPPASPPLSPVSPSIAMALGNGVHANHDDMAAFTLDASHGQPSHTTNVLHANHPHGGLPSIGAPAASVSTSTSPVPSPASTLQSWPFANIDKVFISVGVEAIEAFVSPTDVDVNAGIVWMSEQSHGLLKSIMSPASFMSSITFRPYLFLPDHSPLYPSWAPPPRSSPGATGSSAPAAAPSPTMSDINSTASTDGPKRGEDEIERGLNSVLIQLNILQFAMDAHQFALMLDVFKTVAAPLPYAGEGDEMAKKEEVRAMKLEDLQSEVVMVNLARRRMEWQLRHQEWMLHSCSPTTGSSPPFGPIAMMSLEKLANASPLSSPLYNTATSFSLGAPMNMNPLSSPAAAAGGAVGSTPHHHHQPSIGSLGGLGMIGLGKEDVWSMSRVEAATMQSNLQELVMEYSQLNEKFASLLLNLRLKNETMPAASIPLRNIQVELYIDSVTYSLVRNAAPWFNIMVEGVAVSAVIFDDLSGEFTLEIRNISGRNLDYASKPNCREHAWADVILPLELKERSDSWNDRNVMVNAHAVKKVVNGRNVVPHLEANVYPLNIRLTYDTLFNIAAYFVYDQEKLTKEYTKHKTRFLPVSEVLEIDGPHKPSASDIQSAHRPGASSSSLSSSSSSAGSILNAIERGRLGTAFEMYRSRAAAFIESLDEPFTSPTSSDRAVTSPPGGGGSGSAGGAASSSTTGAVKKKPAPSDTGELYEFTYIRLGRTRFVVSYLGNKQHNIEDFQGLVVRLKGFVYQRRVSTLEKLGRRLRKDIIKNLLSQVGETLGSFLSYKLGMRSMTHLSFCSMLFL